MMNREETIRKIVECAEYCERELRLESTYFFVEDFDSCAICAQRAEVESLAAFSLASFL